MMEFKSWFKEKVRIVDEYLEKVIEEKENPQKIIYEAMNYSLLSGGKRLRPLLLMGSYELFKDDLKEALEKLQSLTKNHKHMPDPITFLMKHIHLVHICIYVKIIISYKT